ncbi:hypothetical protein VSS37_00025 [Candidatus Thiothrix sp. Deng01]|uniref:Uncharacterized protein n=1 Tax=Candidatus Thiothrix phosphatis TaxID=3112415 RepID=A0ABU6CRF8_9GAMM|nr:hypothetical protein [Candidatus Thiothrix sp. Deng01]MEB4589355.1 hypothetical protein [Candidatus Thiothrix sp. Deng01]
MKTDNNIVSFDADKGKNHYHAAISLADWLETSGLIKCDVRKSNLSALIMITPRQDGRCDEQLASINLAGNIETRISEQAIYTLRALVAERATPDAAKAIDGRIVIITAVSLLAGRVAERAIKQLAGVESHG